MKRILFAAAALLFGLTSCTKDMDEAPGGNPGKDIKINFSVQLPGGGDVVYPKSRAEGGQIHDASEFEISKIDLYEFAVGEAEPQTVTLINKHTFTKGQNLVSVGNGVYSMTLTIPYKHYMEKRKFVFVANDDLASAGITLPQDGGAGMSYDKFAQMLASIGLAAKDDASKLAPAGGIAMSGVGKVNDNEIITLHSAFNCDVHLQRIVARVDVINNTPNMVITNIRLLNAASKAYIMAQTTPQAPVSADLIEMAFNTKTENGNTADDAKHGLSDNYQDQHNNGAGLKKVFYMYERENNEGNYSSVEISYTLNGTTPGQIVVPFRKRDAGQAWVNIERNHLYKITLGNGKDVVTDRVEISLVDEDWNVVDVDHDVDVEQDKMNAALLVNMFTAYNVREVELKGINGGSANKVLSFETEVTNTTTGAPAKHYISFADLTAAGVAGVATPATFTCDANPGVTYRLPTSGEILLVLPQTAMKNTSSPTPICKNPIWGDNEISWDKVPETETKKIYKMDENPFIETIYLTNNADGTQNTTATNTEGLEDKVITGRSQLKRDSKIGRTITLRDQTINISVVYGLRFYGSSQHAAYRWEMCGTNNTDNYFSVKIKALKQYDAITTIDKVANEEFWANGYIELKFPASGRITSSDSQTPGSLGSISNLGTSTKDFAVEFDEYLIGTCGYTYRFPLRLVKVSK